jgi:hypothetical protein
MAYGTINAEQLTTQSGYTLGAGNASSFKNRIINGGMTVSQYNSTTAITPSTTAANVFTTDRWSYYASQASKYTFQQVTDAPTGFGNSLKCLVASAVAVGAADRFSINQAIEGFNFYDFAFGTASAKSVTISFWVYSSLTGTFSGSMLNYAGNRSYPFTYTISSANTWEQKTVTIAGDTSGTWVGATNAGAAYVFFSLGMGSNFKGTAGSWQSGTYLGATGETSIVGTAGATFYITGIQLEVGTVATSFDYRSYGTELALCQRYYEVFYADSAGEAGFASAWSASYRWIWHMKVQKRATSTFALVGAGNWQVNTPSVNGGISSVGAYSAVGNYYLQGGANAIAGAASAEL